MRINIFTKIMLALISVILILSGVFIYTSLNNAEQWAGKQTIEFRDSLKEKYQILVQTVAGNLKTMDPDYGQLKSIVKKHPEIKSIKVLKENEKGDYIDTDDAGQISGESSKMHEAKPKKDEEAGGHGTSADSSKSDSGHGGDESSMDDEAGESGSADHGADSDNSTVDKTEKSIESGSLSLAELKDIRAGKSVLSFVGKIEGHGGSHDVMTDKQFLKVVEPVRIPDHAAMKPEFTNGALVAEISLIEPLKEIHIRHLETSGYFIRISLIAFALSTLVALLVGGFIARGITRPVKKLMSVAEEVSMGRDVSDIDVKSNDEIGDLADSFQRMVTAVKFLMMKEEDEDESLPADS